MKLKLNHPLYHSEINTRGIEYLVHFTRFESITAIVGEGRILPRSKLHNIAFEWGELVTPNSETRYDDPSEINTSIMHPNVYLLDIFQNRWHPGSRYCIIGINPKYIYEANTRFTVTNATYNSGIRFGINGRIETFRAMFAENISIVNPHSRHVTVRNKALAAYYPTDPQAEVLISCEIPYDEFLFIACRDQFEYDLLASAFDVLRLPTEKFRVHSTLFKYRK
jgi:ssDNA thymidine ADP-ribosyltransferase, DarT